MVVFYVDISHVLGIFFPGYIFVDVQDMGTVVQIASQVVYHLFGNQPFGDLLRSFVVIPCEGK